jgi:hypothetical protein
MTNFRDHLSTLKKTKRYLFCALLLVQHFVFAQHIDVRKGIADIRNYNFQENGPLELSGEWEFYMSQFLAPADFTNETRHAKDYVDFPSVWNNSSGPQNFGFATYRLTVLVDRNEHLALYVPHAYSSYKLWANGTEISINGLVGKSRESSIPKWLPLTVNLAQGVDTLNLVLQISNFHHAIGGIRKPFVIGRHDEMLFRNAVAMNSNIVLIGGLAGMSVIYLFVFLLYRSNSVVLFAMMSLVWGIRAAFSNQYVAIKYFPNFPWELAVKIEYISLFLIMVVAMLFIGSLFKEDVNTVFKYLFCSCNLIFVGVTLVVDASTYTQFLPVYLSFAAVLIVYIVYVLIRAVVYDRQSVWLIISCVFLGVIIFSYDLVSYQGFATYNPIITSFGYLAMFVLMAIALLFQVGIFKRSATTNMLTYEDLYGGNNSSR